MQESPFSVHPSEPIPTVGVMPQWIFLLVITIAAWLAVSIVGGLLVGRLIGFVERHVSQPRRRIA